ncbi:MAG: FecR domain-containing protein [Pirellulales bacterium]
MSTLVDLPEQFFLLVDRYCSATNTADEAVELETLLRDNRDAERYFLDHCHLQAQLYQQHATVSAVRESLRSVINDLSVGYRSRVWNSVRRVVVTNLAASLMVAGLTVTIIMLSLALIVPDWERSAPVAGTPSTEFVARIERTSQADFDAASDGNFQNRDLFDDDKIVLNSGLVVIEYDTGARVVLEGPATYQLQGANGGDLRQGRLVAHVPPTAAGYRVATRLATVTDLGTRFGMEVQASGELEVATFEGEVEVAIPDAAEPRRQVIAAGMGLSVTGGNGGPVQARTGPLQRQHQFSRLVPQLGNLQPVRWKRSPIQDIQVFRAESKRLNNRGDQARAIDGDLQTWSFLTPSSTVGPHVVALDLGGARGVAALRVAKFGDTDNAGGAPGLGPIDHMDLQVLYTTDKGPLHERTYAPVDNLRTFAGERIRAASVDSVTGEVDNDRHNFAKDGWYRFGFEPVEATAIALRFARDEADTAPYTHYRVFEFEVLQITPPKASTANHE